MISVNSLDLFFSSTKINNSWRFTAEEIVAANKIKLKFFSVTMSSVEKNLKE